MNANVLSM